MNDVSNKDYFFEKLRNLNGEEFMDHYAVNNE